ncbi:MAG: phosphoribosyltransferase [Candidatus Nomurabacteria bacterium]|nr:phosphoribosyltransferase [Candidatus Nomurabacteria bacterium]
MDINNLQNLPREILEQLVKIPGFILPGEWTSKNGVLLPCKVDAEVALKNKENIDANTLMGLIKYKCSEKGLDFSSYDTFIGIETGGWSFAQRLQAITKIPAIKMNKETYEIAGRPGKNVLFIDDVLATGTSLTNGFRKLTDNHHIQHMDTLVMYDYELATLLINRGGHHVSLSTRKDLIWALVKNKSVHLAESLRNLQTDSN